MRRKTMLAAVLMAGAAMMTGCTADVKPAVTNTPEAMQQQTSQPAEAQPDTSPDAGMEEEETRQLTLRIDGKEADENAVKENEKLLLPLEATGKALGFAVSSKENEGKTENSREIVLKKDDSRITVSYEVSDNTIRRISWQKDGLLIPVDTAIRTFDGVVYVPAAFFEEAAGVRISEGESRVEVSSPEPMDTTQINQ